MSVSNISVQQCEWVFRWAFSVFHVVMCPCVAPQEDEMLGGPLCTVLSNNHNFHLTGKWYDEKCSEGGYGFICQKPQGSLSFPFLFPCSCFSFACVTLHPSGENPSAGLSGPDLLKVYKNIFRHAANERRSWSARRPQWKNGGKMGSFYKPVKD